MSEPPTIITGAGRSACPQEGAGNLSERFLANNAATRSGMNAAATRSGMNRTVPTKKNHTPESEKNL
jgi:hypothetical protein